MPLIQSREDGLGLEALQSHITFLENRISLLENQYPAQAESTLGVTYVSGFLHNFEYHLGWGIPPYTDWSYSNADMPLQPFRVPRLYSIEQLYNAFTTWGDLRYAPLSIS